ncbi:DUF4190 domain-containing protein [Microbacterium sp. BWT-B31]|uniref:DUF4190 domain-containing protein n=1 Tax=Microbacterium sp. BWT-B31 TaxID=3232072 RepID=UPI003527DFFF
MTIHNDIRSAAWSALQDPATTGAELAAIAAEHPEFAGAITRHPNAYPDLVEWARSAAAHPAESPASGADAGNGVSYSRRGRRLWIISAALLAASAVVDTFFADLIAAASSSGPRMLISTATLAGVVVCSVLPIVSAAVAGRTVGRKVGGIVLAIVAAGVVALLIGTSAVQSGWESIVSFGLPWAGASTSVSNALFCLLWTSALFVSWAITWSVRARGYLGLIPLAAAPVIAVLLGYLVYRSLFGLLLGGLVGVVLPAAAVAIALWASRASDRAAARRGAASVPSSFGGPTASDRTNTMAILSLVLAFVFSIPAVILGHVSLSQIRRTGEQGRGLAIAGLVLGYLGIAGGLIAAIAWLVLLSTVSSSYPY